MKKTLFHSAHLLPISAILLCFMVQSCIPGLNYEKGNGAIQKEERSINSFSEIEVSGAYNIILSQDSVTSLMVETDSNLLDFIITRNEGSKLIIENNESLSPSKETNIYISTPNINAINISGASDIKSVGHVYTERMLIVMSGASEIKLNLTAKDLSFEVSGAAILKLSGEADNVTADISGAAEINAFELKTKNFSLSESGSGSADLYVTDKLVIDISGAATVRYKGNPEIDQEVSGAGHLYSAD